MFRKTKEKALIKLKDLSEKQNKSFTDFFLSHSSLSLKREVAPAAVLAYAGLSHELSLNMRRKQPLYLGEGGGKAVERAGDEVIKINQQLYIV